MKKLMFAKPAPRARVHIVEPDRALVVAVADSYRARWAYQQRLAPVSAAALRGMMLKAARLGYSTRDAVSIGGATVAQVALDLARARDPEGSLPIFVIVGASGDAAPALESVPALAGAGRDLVVVLCTPRARPDEGAVGAAWDRLEFVRGVRRFRVPNMREAAHFRAGIDAVALVIEGLGGGHGGRPLTTAIAAGVDLVRRARESGVPCIAVEGPVGFDPESGARRRGAPGCDISLLFHRSLLAHHLPAAQKMLGEIVVAPIQLPADADPAAR
jgi:NAD(P)H-hydrate repair Nnr-like enzyme with NAD(P)H-hydrate epimerase domain